MLSLMSFCGIMVSSLIRSVSTLLQSKSSGLWTAILGGVLLMTGIGCRPKEVRIATAQSDADQVQTEQSVQEELDSAMEFVQDFDEYQEEAVLGRILHDLRKWSEPQKPDVNWIADPLFARMPARLNLATNPALLSSLTFGRSDVDLLRESLWMRDLAQRLSSVEPIDGTLATWLKDELPQTVTRDHAEALRKVAVIFDWIITSIQVEPLMLTSEEMGDADASLIRPSIRRTAFESLLIGRGDALIRARIAILVSRQIGIPCVLVGPTGENEPAPWWLGAVIGKELYLFDPQWGIPIPGPEGKGIATLRMLVEQPQLLNALDVDEAHPYRVRPDEVHDLALWIDASREAISQRMRLVERKLSREHKMVLTVSPSEIRLQVRDQPSVTQVGIWTQPYDLLAFRMQIEKAPQLIDKLNRELMPLTHPWPLARARRKHIRGFFADTDFELGARQLYLKMRIPEARRNALDTTQELQEVLQEILGEPQALPDDQAMLVRIMTSTQEILKMTKYHASYWLGNIAMEMAEYPVAVDFFRTRTLEADPDGPWVIGAKYNLGRALEAQGKKSNDEGLLMQAAESFLSETDSPQGGGNRWRGMALQKK
jgi:AraC-like DNA-binding protein